MLFQQPYSPNRVIPCKPYASQDVDELANHANHRHTMHCLKEAHVGHVEKLLFLGWINKCLYLNTVPKVSVNVLGLQKCINHEDEITTSQL